MTFKIKQEISEGGTRTKLTQTEKCTQEHRMYKKKGKNRVTISGMPVM